MNPIDLRHYIRIYDADLSPDMCTRMVQSFQTLARFHTPNGRGYRAGLENSAWTEVNVTRLSDAGLPRFFPQQDRRRAGPLQRDVGLGIPIPNSPKICRPDPEAVPTRAGTSRSSGISTRSTKSAIVTSS